jgi:hypothetical protein
VVALYDLIRLQSPQSTLTEQAAMWQDMEPHLGHLRDLASEVTTILEWGVRGGVSTWAMLDGLPESGRMVSVDIERHPLPVRVEDDPRWSFVLGDDLGIQHDPAELVFIDTNHEYAHTLAELRTADRLGARIIALHDWMLEPVQAAVSRWMPLTGWSLEIMPSRWGLAVLRRKP